MVNGQNNPFYQPVQQPQSDPLGALRAVKGMQGMQKAPQTSVPSDTTNMGAMGAANMEIAPENAMGAAINPNVDPQEAMGSGVDLNDPLMLSGIYGISKSIMGV